MPETLDATWTRLTEAIVQLQRSIQVYRGFPPHSASNDAGAHGLDLLATQLSAFESELKKRGQWGISTGYQPDPFLDIDLSDLDDAINHLDNAIHMPRYPRQAKTPHAHFSTQNWVYDLQWSEWSYTIQGSGHRVFLTEWECDTISGEWQMVWQGQRTMEEALDMLGSWEDWDWDEHWGEWYLPSVADHGLSGDKRIYASEWKRMDDGNWVYVEQSESKQGKTLSS
ncbi:hypothetical protein GRF29_19g1824177 [Pseudopithomyces chartarum]|uniref:Uncharacterized protein n=1 Tax=Pseudopithomyces chartarum TaxID=1892770 RepID=A0AAN6M4B4_9PLEO|nr:hypothetical protein GRF29_19g1824177 [Pseudopithomyces chartarum]